MTSKKISIITNDRNYKIMIRCRDSALNWKIYMKHDNFPNTPKALHVTLLMYFYPSWPSGPVGGMEVKSLWGSPWALGLGASYPRLFRDFFLCVFGQHHFPLKISFTNGQKMSWCWPLLESEKNLWNIPSEWYTCTFPHNSRGTL